MGGDINYASSAAIKDFKRIYSGSHVGLPNKKESVMAYAPEREYGLTEDEVKDDLRRFAVKNNIKEPGKVFVAPDAQTGREEQKTYRVFAIVSELPIQQWNKDGTPMRWSPDLEGMQKRTHAEAQKQREEFEQGLVNPLLPDEAVRKAAQGPRKLPTSPYTR